ncbi:MAG TPA: ATP-binding cassette domain-containing protein [Azospirillum sp.]|nr:ATP-binding cassette domain-containing protein [Azospirillum sp.]
MAILSIRDVTKTFGGLAAVDHVSFDVAEGELVGLIGPNGSGKTTLINMLSGLLPVGGGDILLDGASLLGLSPDRIARRGVLRMFQLTRAFNRISALDNLLVAGRALGLGAEEATRRALTLLEELRIDHVMNLDAGQLSGGQRKLLEFGTCFMVPPRVALLDEPFAAVHPTMRAIMADFVRRRHAEGQTFLLVSHDMPIVKELCPRSVCMNAGAVIADAPTRAVLDDPHVIEAYLGGHAA